MTDSESGKSTTVSSETMEKRYRDAMALAAEGRIAEAAAAFEAVVRDAPGHADAWYNLGVSFRRLHRETEAAQCYQRAVDAAPDHADARFNLGNAHYAAGRPSEAVACYERVVAAVPGHAAAQHNLGLALKVMGRFEAAARVMEEALRHDPENAEYHNGLGTVCQARGRMTEALACFDAALDRDPEFTRARYNRGYTLAALDRNAEAEACLRRVIDRAPEMAEAWVNLGTVLKKEKRLTEAVDCFERALAISPRDPDALNNLGNALENLGRPEDAVAALEQAIALRKWFPHAQNNLGVALSALSRADAAAAHFRRALADAPDFTEARFNLAVNRLLCGDFRAGWDAYESRLDDPAWTHIHPHRYSLHRWTGAPFPSQTLYVYDEQGFGDTIQFLRYLPWAKARGGTVVFETRPPLIPLVRGAAGIDRVVARPKRPEPAASADFGIPLMSLPGIFDTTLETIPAEVPYLAADPDRVETWKARLPARGLKVGIAWAGNPNHQNDANRSIPLIRWKPIFGLTGLRVFGLQKGPGSESGKSLEVSPPFENFGPEFVDFADAAAAVAAMDLVISVDTAVAHLAGALDRPVWLLLPHVPDWRWLLDRTDSPWYPGMRLFRQPAPGDWDSVMAAVCKALKGLNGRPVRPRDEIAADTEFQAAAREFANGDPGLAEIRCREILRRKPNHPDALNLAAAVALQKGHADDALGYIDRAVSLAPENVDYGLNRVRVLAALGRGADAEQAAGALAARFPEHAAAQTQWGRCLLSCGRPESAETVLFAAHRVRPGDVGIRLALAEALLANGRAAAAADVFEDVIALSPERAAAHNGLGKARAMTGDFEAAKAALQKAVSLAPARPEFRNDLGVCYHRAGRFDEALDAFDAAIARAPDHADARFNRGQIRLLLGDYQGGWADYEWRTRTAVWRRRVPESGVPEWDGRPFAGECLVIRGEQGFGDTIQCLRYLPWVNARGGRVVVEAHPALHGLVSRVPGVDEIVLPAPDGRPAVNADWIVSMMSLPARFATTPENMPGKKPYIQADPDLVRQWAERMGPTRGRMRIGLVWAGSPQHANDGNRSCPLAAFAPILELDGIACFGFQKEGAEVAIAALPEPLRFENLGSGFRDFSDTAGALAGIDLLISVDTAPAHLAGAMGVATWLLVSRVPDWRWRTEGNESPWYPSMRLYRQPAPGAWDPVITRIVRDLKNLPEAS